MQFRNSNKIAVLFLIASLISAIGCQKSNVQASGAPKAMPVNVLVAKAYPVDETSEYVATIKSRSSTTLSPQVDGQVTHIYVKSGDRVSAGTPLMQIDPLKQQATVGSQEATRASKLANLRYAEQQLARVQKRYEAGVVSKQDFDQSQSAYDAAKADLQSLDAQVREQHVQLRYFKITAPTDGVVGDIPVHVGDRVTPTTVLTTVDQRKDLEAYIDVPIEKAPDLTIGRLVQIIGSDNTVVANSKISFISPHVNDQTQTILVKASINASKTPLRNAQFVRARIVWGSHQRVLIPVLSVSRINGQFFAFVAEESGGNSVA